MSAFGQERTKVGSSLWRVCRLLTLSGHGASGLDTSPFASKGRGSARVPEARSNSVNRNQDTTLRPFIGFSGSPAAQELNLKMIKGCDVGEPVRDGAGERRIVGEAPSFTCDGLQCFDGTRPLQLDHCEDIVGGSNIRHQFGVAPCDAQVCLSQHHIHIGQQCLEEWPFSMHALQQCMVRSGISREKSLDGCSEPEPAGQSDAALPPGKAPGNGSEVLDAPSRTSRGRARTNVQLSNFRNRRCRKEIVSETWRFVHQLSVSSHA